MAMPQLSGLVRLMAQIVAIIGCLAGVITTLGKLAAFQWGFLAGLTAMGSGVLTVANSLAGLGLVDCFLALVAAQIDTKNALVASRNSE